MLVETAVEAVGADRIVWGTNLPLSYPGPNLIRITEAAINEREKRQILGENILRILA
jgi:predicted TIM-barrel fold metal-dependent hydrolase